MTKTKIGYKYIESLICKMVKKLDKFELYSYTNNHNHLTYHNEDLLSTVSIIGKDYVYDEESKESIKPELILDIYYNYNSGKEIYYLSEPLSDSLLPYNEFFESLTELTNRLSSLYNG